MSKYRPSDPARSGSGPKLCAGGTLEAVVALVLLAGLAAVGSIRAQENESYLGVPVPKEVIQANAGPWGELEYYFVMLEVPESLWDRWVAPPTETRWIFRSSSQEEVEALLASAGVPGELRKQLREDRFRRTDAAGRIVVTPPDSVVTALPPLARRNLYLALGEWEEENTFHADPAFIESGDVRNWFAGIGIPQEMIAEIEQLSYPSASGLAFSDFSYLLREVSDLRERKRLTARIQARTRSLILRMRASDASALDALEDYWTIGGRQKDALPILRSVIRTPGVERLDLAHLLPPTPRRLLYTYPLQERDGLRARRHCHWTCANFLRDVPSDRLIDDHTLVTFLEKNHRRVQPPYQYGDVLVLVRDVDTETGTGSAFHSCVYIADDIVFSKNGAGIIRPWIFMKLSDLRTIYPGRGAVATEAFRPR